MEDNYSLVVIPTFLYLQLLPFMWGAVVFSLAIAQRLATLLKIS
ncbi:hypothetical protein LWHH1689_1730 [Limosilactobacillus reuteri]|uniref:Uncharacterized protein n=1 Tax=Limosilactobacillus reuteri TaxID=1598 RepID=A0A2S1ESW2_LIMRT|nr:hypothetical protein LWHH1689_1730 [Limosilactobacillus reuteri]